MSTKLETLLEFCVEHELLDTSSSKRISSEQERHWDSEFEVVINSGVDEQKMYEIAANIHQLSLVSLVDIIVDEDIINHVSLDHALQLYCIPYSITSSELCVVFCDWKKWEVVTQGMANLTKKKINANLISYTDYQSLHKRLSGH